MGQKHSRLAPDTVSAPLSPHPVSDDLDIRLALVEGDEQEPATDLLRTPSARRDLDSGLSPAEAAKASRLRTQLRSFDAEIVQLKSELVRGALLRGPSGRRRTCDADVILGGCGEEFAEEDGIYCSGETGGCSLFLCFQCFGGLVVANECQVGGRFDRHVSGDGDAEVGAAAHGASPAAAVATTASAPGSLPCPLYPQACNCAHISLYNIQRALLHPDNRGKDGIDEDIDSVGISAHKIFLIARRRQAEGQVNSGINPID